MLGIAFTILLGISLVVGLVVAFCRAENKRAAAWGKMEEHNKNVQEICDKAGVDPVHLHTPGMPGWVLLDLPSCLKD